MILVMKGEMAEMLAFSRAEGKGSRAQGDGLIFPITSSTSPCVMLKKEQRGWTFSDCGSTVGGGGVQDSSGGEV